MKKIFTFLAAAVLSIASSTAATFTFTSDADMNQTVDGYTVALAKGSGSNVPAVFYDAIRLYANNTITVSGSNLTEIRLSFSKQGSKDYASLTASTGSLVSGGTSSSNDDIKTDVWTGSASSVTFTLGSGQRIIVQVVVNGDGSEQDPSTPGNPDTPDTPSADLDPDFVYPEPTLIGVPDKTVQGDAYTFIGTNVEVACTKGAITADYFSAHAGFEMTFTATKPIKGLVINGMVKKDFTATTDHGNISYLTPSQDTDADPVVVVTDVDATSVTISCVKQLRCYTVEIYFESNPEATVGGNGGESIDLTFDSAEAVYESEYVELIGEENYSIFLFNEASYEYPYFALDIYPAQKDVLQGTYNWDDYTLGDYTYYLFGEGEYDIAWCEGGEVKIAKSGETYTITGTLYCDDGNTYNISFSGKMPIYLDEDYYGDGGDGNGVEEVAVEMPAKTDGETYDLQGRRVGKTYRGIVIRNGAKEVLR